MPFPFLLLPGEIRNRIYEHCLCPNKEVIINGTKTGNSGWIPLVPPTTPKSPGQRLALLQTNKQINKEATPYFFAENTFRFLGNSESAIEDVFDAAGTYIDGLSSERRNMIRQIRLGLTFEGFMILQEGDFQDFGKVLGTAEKLRHLEVNIVADTCRCRDSVEITGHVQSLFGAFDPGVCAKVSLCCGGGRKGLSGIADLLANHEIVGWRDDVCDCTG